MIRQTIPAIHGDTDENKCKWIGFENQKLPPNSPRMIKMDLNEGSTGTVMTLWIDGLPLGKYTPKLTFNTLIVDTKVVRSQGVTTLVAPVPSHRETRCSTMMVPIYLCLLEGDNVVATWHLVDFSYEGIMQLESPDQVKSVSLVSPLMTSPPTPPQTTTTMTSVSSTVSQPMISPPCHEEFYSNLSVQCELSNGNDRYQPTLRQRSSLIADLPYNDDDSDFTKCTSGFTDIFAEHLDQNTTPTTSIQYPPRANVIQSKSTFCIPTTTSNYISAPASAYHDHRHRTSLSHPKSHPFDVVKASGHQSSLSVATYQPYPGLISRANLVLSGDLKSMTENWYPEEWQRFRRLVCFHRENVNRDIECSFKQIAPNVRSQTDTQPNHHSNRTATTTTTTSSALDETSAQQQQQNTMTAPTMATNSTVVSCIYWPEKEDWFITSVDCIHLLEHLLDLKFSVEEKNRVRRNLEGFHPLTIKKSQSDSANFFKLIMSFPNPKPRNIEKDLKVFRWKTLPYALKKIVTKYTSSAYEPTTLTNDNQDSSMNTKKKRYIRHQTLHQDTSPSLSPATLSSSSCTTSTSTTTTAATQLPTMSSSSTPSSSSALYYRRTSAPTPARVFNDNSDYRPFFPLSSPTSLTYQPLSFAPPHPLSNADSMTGYRFDPTTTRLPPLDEPYALPNLISPTQAVPIPPRTSSSPSMSPITSEVQHLF